MANLTVQGTISCSEFCLEGYEPHAEQLPFEQPPLEDDGRLAESVAQPLTAAETTIASKHIQTNIRAVIR